MQIGREILGQPDDLANRLPSEVAKYQVHQAVSELAAGAEAAPPEWTAAVAMSGAQAVHSAARREGLPAEARSGLAYVMDKAIEGLPSSAQALLDDNALKRLHDLTDPDYRLPPTDSWAVVGKAAPEIG